MPKLPIHRVQDLYASSERRDGSSCWHWIRGKNAAGCAQMWALDYDRAEKRPMRAARAVWYVVHRAPLGDRCAWMRCVNPLCVNPDHLMAGSRLEMIAHIKATGVLRGRGTYESRAANLRKARAAQGIVETPAHIVRIIREADASVTGVALAARLGMSMQTVSNIRRGRTRVGVEFLEAA